MGGPFAARIAQVRTEWSTNARLRLGVGLMAVVGLVYLLLVLADWRAALHDEYQQRTRTLAPPLPEGDALPAREEFDARIEPFTLAVPGAVN